MVRGLIWLALLGIVVYIAYLYATPQLRAWRLRDAMNQTARLAGTQPDEELRTSLIETAGELGVPLPKRRLAVRRDLRGRLQVSATWEEVVRLEAAGIGEWVDTLHFSYEVEGSARRSRR